MKKYCLDKNTHENGNYEIHLDDCEFSPTAENKINLGFHDTAITALSGAKKLYPEVEDKIDACNFCIKID